MAGSVAKTFLRANEPMDPKGCDPTCWTSRHTAHAPEGASLRSGTDNGGREAPGMTLETAFSMDTSSIKFGPGATREVGHDMRHMGGRRVMVVTDPRLADSEPVAVTMDALRSASLDAVLFDQAQVEPSGASLKAAIEFAADGRFNGYVAVGGGSSIDTAKAADLYASWPADFLAYVNPPIGEGRPVPGRLAPLVAIPTTAGTGSETTGVVVFDLPELHAKTAIRHRAARPALGIIDPHNTRALPKMVAACSGLDVLCHALESLTALPYSRRSAPESPAQRPAYQGANPISEVWAERAIEMSAANLLRALDDGDDAQARAAMLLAATFAGIGFGNAGVHLAHAMSYPVSGMVRDYVADGYPPARPLVPHGMSVALNAPAVFRFTATADPGRHRHAAELLGLDATEVGDEEVGELLAHGLVELMRKAGMPNGLAALGYGPNDLDQLVAGTLPQRTVTVLSPRPASAADLRQLFIDSMTLWQG
jgi:hydroxyacid-oxoacid transhydrogenase